MPSAALVEPSSGPDDFPNSLEHVKSSDLFPKQSPHRVPSAGELESAATQAPEPFICPFALLPGESVLKWGRIKPLSTIFLTNYRLFVNLGEANGFYTVPLLAVESVEPKDMVYLNVCCKDGRVFKIALENGQNCLSWFRELSSALNVRRDDIYAFAFYAWCTEERKQLSLALRSSQIYVKDNAKVNDFRRLAFDDNIWRVTDVNEHYECCDSYPRHWIVPAWLTDKELLECAKARFFRRVPAVVWRHQVKGSVLLRSSQPSVGIFGWRYPMDERLLQFVLRATAQRLHSNGHLPNGDAQPSDVLLSCVKPMLIIDARSYTAAWANRAKGGGFESQECYQHCEVQFMSLANIHNIRYSFQQLRTLLSSPPNSDNYLQNLQSTQWMQNLSNLLSSALRVVEALEVDGRSVLVHCSDGWDRTPQIVSLAKLLLDSHYRTIKGFKELVEREWIEFGHKFADRCGVLSQDSNEHSPVFLQWLDCVHQLMEQFPCAFEFNRPYLVKLAQHAHSGLFGTFLWNSDKEARIRSSGAFSIWQYLHPDNDQFRNCSYDASMIGTLWPAYQLCDMRLWRTLYCSNSQPTGSPKWHRLRSDSRSGAALERSLTRAHSCDSLTSVTDTMQGSLIRTGSDSNLTPSSSKSKIDQPAHSVEDVNFVLDELLTKVSNDVTKSHDVLPRIQHSTPFPDRPASHADLNSLEFSFCAERTESSCAQSQTTVVANGGSSSGSDFEDSNATDMKTSTSEISDSLVARPYMNAHKGRPHREPPNGIRTFENGYSSHERKRKSKRRKTMADFLDTDGLTKVSDPEQDRMREQKAQMQKRCEMLELELQTLRCRPAQSLLSCHRCGGRPAADVDEMNGDVGFEPHSYDSTGGASDISWENVEDRDTNPTRWVPDHQVTNCMACDIKFWTINRKHHCRSCGKVFCSACSQFESPVPEEQLYDPVRVCRHCFESLSLSVRPTVVVGQS